MLQEVISGEALLELIPQREPVVMIGSFMGITECVSYTGLKISEENIFCEGGVFQEYGLIEHIAQSAAARIGYIYRCHNKRIPLGFIGSVDKMTIHALPLVADELETAIRVEQEVGEITLISARVVCKGKVMCEGHMKIFLNQEEA